MFGIALSVKSRVCECTPELFHQMVDAPQTGRTCAEIADAWEAWKRGELTREEYETKKAELKRQLPVMTPHAMFPQGRRKNEEAVPSGLSMYDIDHIENPRGYYEERVASRTEELGIVLAHVTPSMEGLRLVFRMPAGMSLAEAQKWMSQQLGDTAYDGCVKDMARCSFLVPRDYILFLNEQLFDSSLPPLVINENENAARTKTKNKNNNENDNVNVNENVNEKVVALRTSLEAFDLCAKQAGLDVEAMDVWGVHNWHTNLMAVMSVGVGKLMSREQLMAVVAERLPNYSQTEDCQKLIDYFYEKYDTGKGFMNANLREINAKVQHQVSDNANDNENWNENTNPDFKLDVEELPMGLRESLMGVPKDMYMPVLCAVLPLAAAYADGVEVEYCDGQRMRLGLMSIIRGEQASGKSVCKGAVDVWKHQLDKEDRLARQREDEWKEQKKGRRANEKAPEDPKVMIRMVPVTVSCSTLLKRLKNSNGHTLYSFCEELDTLRKTNGAGSWSSKYDIYRLSFDNGEWGQDYNSDQAESGVVRVAYNWTMLGTNGALRKCFRQDNIENGLSSRVLVAEMPDSSFARMPKFGRRSEEDEARIQEAVNWLRAQTGFVDTPQLRKTMECWVEEKRVVAAKNIDRVMDVYRKRAAVIGFRCGVVHHLLQTHPQPLSVSEGSGQKTSVENQITNQEESVSTPLPTREGKGESPSTIKFAEMMAEYCLEQQIKAFGEALQNEFVAAKDEVQRYGRNHSVFDQLPAVFSVGDLRALKHGFCEDSSLRSIISRWKLDGWVEKVDVHHWKKTTQ